MPTRFNPVLSPPFTPSAQLGNPVISPPVSQTQTPISTFTPSFKTHVAPSSASASASSTKRDFQRSHPKSQSQLNSRSKAKPSLALSCQSPDALAIHTLLDIKNGTTVIQTNTLPLNHESSKTIHTNLPSWLNAAFEIDPPCELLCVDNDTTSSSSLKSLVSNVEESTDTTDRKILLPLLCVYTMKSVYILQLSVLPIYNSSNPADIIRGQIESIHEPFESYLQTQKEEHNDYHLYIQRVRSAPYTQLSNTFGTNNIMMYNLSPFIPRGCIAVLISSKKKKKTSTYKFVDDSDSENENDIEEAELNHSQLVLYHGVDNDETYGDKNDDELRQIRHRLEKSNIRNVTKKKKQFHNITATEMNTLETIVDFTFLPSFASTSPTSSSSSSCSLWNGMTIALSSREGDLYTMTPVVFHGMAIPKHILLDALNHLQKQKHKNGKENDNTSNTMAISVRNENDDVFYRRNVAAIAYIKDVFGIVPDKHNGNDQRKIRKLQQHQGQQQGNFVVTANIFNHVNRERNAASWPITIQGPVYTPSEPCVHEVTCLESLPPSLSSNNTDIDGVDFSISTSGYTSSLLLARGDNGQCVQYVMIPSGVNCIPRFAFESSQDCNTLDEVVDNVGSLMEEIFLDNDDDENIANGNEEANFNHSIGREGGQKNVIIHIDPIDNSMIHHFSKFGVVTITSNVPKVMSNRLRNILLKTGPVYSEDEIKTKAWSTIDILQENYDDDSERVAGVNISGDAKIGHILVAVLSDGTDVTFLQNLVFCPCISIILCIDYFCCRSFLMYFFHNITNIR